MSDTARLRKLFLLTTFVVGLGGGMTASFVVILASDLGASDLFTGVIAASSAFAVLLADTLGARAILRLDARRSIAIGCAIFGLGSAVSAVAPSTTLVLIGRALQGLGAAFFMTSSLQLAIRLAPLGREAHSIGTYNAIWFTGISLGPLLGGTIAHVGGLRVAFAVCAVVNLSGTLTAWLLVPSGFSFSPADGSDPRIERPRRSVLRLGVPSLGTARALATQMIRPRAANRQLRTVLVLGAGCQGLRGALPITLIPLFAAHYLDLKPFGVGLVVTVLAVTDVASMQISAIAAERFGRSRTLAFSLLIGSIGALITAIDPTLPVLVGACAMLGVAVGTAWVLPAGMAVDAAGDTQSGVASFRVASDVGMLVGSATAGGLIGAVGGASSFGWTAVVLFVLALAVARFGEPRPAVDQQPTERDRKGSDGDHESASRDPHPAGSGVAFAFLTPSRSPRRQLA